MTDWQDGLTEIQLREIELARLYTSGIGFENPGDVLGASVHLRLPYVTLVAELAERLDAFAASGTVQPAPAKMVDFTVLDVPYHSQHEADARWFRKDCGPACIEMLGECLQPGVLDVTTNEIMQSITDGVERGVYLGELQKAASRFYDVELERHDNYSWPALLGCLDSGRPVITLVHYGSFATRMDRSYIVGHYMVVVGYDEMDYQGQTVERVIVHDPDFYGDAIAQGAFIPIVKPHFMQMWDDCYKDRNPRRMALVPKVGL